MGGPNPLVAVITRTKDRPLLLRRAVESVRSQTYKNYIHIIINDGEPLEQQTPASSTIVFPVHTNGRMEEASNEGVRVALEKKADFIVIHDDDDSWSPEFLSTMIREFFHYQSLVPSVKGIICRANRVYEKVEGNMIIPDHLEPHVSMLPELGLLRIVDLLNDHHNFAPIQFLYQSDAIEKVGYYDPTFLVYGDWDFNLRFLQHFDIALIPNYLAFYHWRVSNSGADANAVLEVDRKLQHEVYRQRIQNRYLREGNMLGLLMNMEKLNERATKAAN